MNEIMKPKRYDAFLSYSHRTDRTFARAFQLALQRFATPFYALRSLRVFRDESNLSAQPDLWGTIEKALDESAYFLLFASPESARSPWVAREVRHFVRRRDFPDVSGEQAGDGFSRLCVVLTEGALPWTDGIEHDDPRYAIAPETVSLFTTRGVEPLVIDLRPFRHRSRLRNAFSDAYRACLAAIASRITGKDKDALYGDHLRQQRILLGVVGVLLMATLAASVIGVQQAFRRRLAETERRHTQARELRGLADAARERGDFAASLVRLAQGHLVHEAEVPLHELTEAKARLHREIWRTPLPFAGFSGRFELGAKGRLVLGQDGDELVLWDAQTSLPLRRSGPIRNGIIAFALAEDCRTAFAATGDGQVQVWDIAGDRLGASWQACDGLPFCVLLFPGGRLCTADDREQVRFWSAAGKMIAEQKLPRHSDDWVLRCAGGSIVAVEPNGTFRRWEAASGRELGRADRREKSEDGFCAVDRAGRLAVRMREADDDSGDRIVEVWEIESGRVVDRVKVPTIPQAATFDAASQGLILGGVDGVLWSHRIGAPQEPWPASRAHSGWIEQLALLDNGRTLLYSANNGLPQRHDRATNSFTPAQHSLRLHDLEKGEPLREFVAHDSPISALAYSPDGQLIASGGADCHVHLWEAATGRELRVLRGHTQDVRCLAFSRDGTLLASGSTDRTARLWDVASGTELRILRGHAGGVHSLAFDRTGGRLATGDGVGEQSPESPFPDWSIRIWDVRTGSSLGTLAGGHRGDVETLSFSPDGALLLSAGADDAVLIWDIATRQPRQGWGGPSPATQPRREKSQTPGAVAAFLPGGQGVLAGFSDGHIELRETQHQAVLRAFAGHRSAITALAVSPDGRRLISGAGVHDRLSGFTPFAPSDDTLRVWDVDTGVERLRLPTLSGGIRALALSPDGRRAAIAGQDLVLRVVALEDGYERARYEPLATREKVQAVAPEGPLLITRVGDQKASYFLTDLARNTRREIGRSEGRIFLSDDVATLAPDGSRLLFQTRGAEGTTTAWLEDIPEGKRRTLPVKIDFGRKARFSHDGTRLAIYDGSDFDVHDVATAERLWRWDQGRDKRRVLAKSDDLAEVLLADDTGGLEVVDIKTSQTRRQVRTSSASPFTAATLTPDGRLLAAASVDGELWLWGERDSTPRQLWGRPLPVTVLAFSRDGSMLASGHFDGSANLWHLASGERLAELRGHREMLMNIGFDRGSDRLMTHDMDGVILAWDVAQARADFEALRGLSPAELVEWAQALTHLVSDGRSIRQEPRPGPLPQRWASANGQPPAFLAEPLPSWVSVLAVRAPSPKVQAVLSADEAREQAAVAQWAKNWQPDPAARMGNLAPDLQAPEISAARGRLADLLQSMQWAAAEQVARELLARTPDDAELWVTLAEAQLPASSPEASASASRALDLLARQKTSAAPLLRQRARGVLGEALSRAGDPFGAGDALAPFFAEGKAVPRFAATYILSLVATGRYERALEIADSLLASPSGASVAPAVRPLRERAALLREAQRLSPRLPAFIVLGVAPMPPPMMAGLRAGDIILKIDGAEHDCPTPKLWSDLVLSTSLPDDPGHTFTVWRAGRTEDVRTQLPLQSIQADIVTPETEPVIRVALVADGTQAQRLGITLADVLWSAAGQRLRSLEQLRAITAGSEPYDIVLRRYRWTSSGALVLRRNGAGEPERGVDGQPHWHCEERTIRVATGPLGIFPALIALAEPVVRTGGERPPAITAEPKEKQQAAPSTANSRVRRDGDSATFDRSATNADLAQIPDRASLRTVRLSSRKITGEALAALNDAQALETLSLAGTQIGDADLVKLGALPQLRVLDLSRTQITDAACADLQRFPQLRTLNLSGTAITDAGAASLCNLPKVADLDLSGTRITDAALPELAKAPSLARLTLSRTSVTGAGLSHLAAARQLRTLRLAGNPLTDEDVRQLGAISTLQSLDLSGTRITDAALMHLAPLSKLTSLTLNNTEITGNGLAAAPYMKRIGVLDLDSTQVRQGLAAGFRDCPRLEVLSLSRCRLSDTDLVHLAALRSLRMLDLSTNNLDGSGLAHLQALSDIDDLDLSNTQLSDRHLPLLKAFQKLKDLRVENTNISAEGFTFLRSAFPDATIGL